ncbi:unnamed protein product, partial [Mesorhabditis spiculigera]
MTGVSSYTFAPKFQHVTGGSHVLNSGFDIPLIGLGCSRIKTAESMEESIRAALEAGYRLFDTAHIYENEKEIGDALKNSLKTFGCDREDIFITTKVPIINDDPAGHAERCIKESLAKLKTDYLDLVLLHYPRDRHTGKDEDYEVNKKGRQLVYQKMEELLEKGTIRSIGVSNYEVYHLEELFEYSKVIPAVNQVEYHPYYTRPTLKHYCEKKGIFIQAFSSLCWGNLEVLNEDAVKKAAQKHNVSPQTILYAFPLHTNVGIIPKSATPQRIHDNLKLTAQVHLSPEEVSALQALDQDRAFCPGCCPWRCLQSLKDLKTDYLDLVLVHFPKDRDHGKHEDYEGNKEARKKTWEKLEELHEQGTIRSIGVSNYEVYHLVELLEYAKILPTVNQFEYHPYYTRPTLKHFCELKGIFVQAFSSLLWENKDIWEEVVLKQIAEKHKVSPQTILYAFPLYNKVGVIPKSATPNRIHDNLKLTLQVKLSPEDVSTLEKLDKNLCCCTPCDGWRAL